MANFWISWVSFKRQSFLDLLNASFAFNHLSEVNFSLSLLVGDSEAEFNQLLLDIALTLIKSSLYLAQINLGLNQSGQTSYGFSNFVARGFLLHISAETVDVYGNFLDVTLILVLPLRDNLLDKVCSLIDISLAFLLKLLKWVLHEVEVVLESLGDCLLLLKSLLLLVVSLFS